MTSRKPLVYDTTNGIEQMQAGDTLDTSVETDPIFSASVAASLTSQQLTGITLNLLNII